MIFATTSLKNTAMVQPTTYTTKIKALNRALIYLACSNLAIRASSLAR